MSITESSCSLIVHYDAQSSQNEIREALEVGIICTDGFRMRVCARTMHTASAVQWIVALSRGGGWTVTCAAWTHYRSHCTY